MTKLEIILEYCEGTQALKADGFDDAIIGYESLGDRLVYSSAAIIDILSKDMSADDVWEYFHFNIAGSYVGEHTPLFVTLV